MAAQTETDVSPTVFSAETVGNAFVGQFYQILHQSPELVNRFYHDSSTMTRPRPDGTLATVTAMEEIKDLILSLDCQDYKVEILTADSQASYMNGVTVLVTGCLTKDNVSRNFTESFFLAPQDNGFFVLNNTFRFIEKDNLPKVKSLEEKEVDKSEPLPVVSVEEPTKASNESVNQPPAVEVVTETVSISNGEINSPAKENVVPQASVDSNPNPNHNHNHIVQPAAAETLSNGHVDPPKKSYASLLKNLESTAKTLMNGPTRAVNAAPVKATQTAQKKPAQSPAVQQTRPASVPAAVSQSSAPNAPNGSNGKVAVQTKEKGYSIYIGGLPYDATSDLVEMEFKKFGRIKKNGIQVRSNKDFVFGFVEYEEAAGKDKAIEMDKIIIGGKEAFIQEKKTSTNVNYPSGRSGYRNDGFRDRGYSNGGGRGYARNDYIKRNGEAPSRGSRNGDGYYLNGSGRGARQEAAAK